MEVRNVAQRLAERILKYNPDLLKGLSNLDAHATMDRLDHASSRPTQFGLKVVSVRDLRCMRLWHAYVRQAMSAGAVYQPEEQAKRP